MAHIQLIERVELPSSLWLTFWDLADQQQLSLEIKDPTYPYDVGQIFVLDKTAARERLALKPVTVASLPGGTVLLIPAAKSSSREAGRRERAATVEIREVSRDGVSAHDGVLSYVA